MLLLEHKSNNIKNFSTKFQSKWKKGKVKINLSFQGRPRKLKFKIPS